MAPSPDVRSTITDDGAILMDISTGKLFHCDPVGAQIWSRLSGGESMDAIIEGISSQFGVPRARVAVDVEEYLVSLKAQRLIF
jgi:hypothetical protein